MLDLITVEGDLDEQPTISGYTPLHASTTTWTDLEVGEGTAITSLSQPVVLDMALFSGDTGELLLSTPYDGSLGAVVGVSQWAQAMPGLIGALTCAQEGSRVVAVLTTPDGIEEGAAASVGLSAGSTAIVVADVRKVYLPKADGEDQFVVGGGLPSVVRAPDGRPGVIIPQGAPPTDLRVEVLKKGSGPVVAADDSVRIAYTGVTWADGTVFDTTWDSEPRAVTLDGVVPGFAQALEGQTVGSQVLAVIPPELGYGDSNTGTLPPGSTLIFVIDILGIDAVAP